MFRPIETAHSGAVIGPIHAEMVGALGKEMANVILDRAIRKAAIAEASPCHEGWRNHDGELHQAL
jgi:hypothetical protein